MKALVVGGSNGIGLSIVLNLVERTDVDRIYIIDKSTLDSKYAHHKVQVDIVDLSQVTNWEFLKKYVDISALYITAGFGHLNYFQDLNSEYITESFLVNTIAPIQILHHFYSRMLSTIPFYSAVMVSIAAHLSSPMFSIYSATKGGLSRCIEALNIELEVQDSPNRILEVSPGSLHGTSFTGGQSDPTKTTEIANTIIQYAEAHHTLWIPSYEETFKNVLERYQSDPHKFGIDSYQYKMKRQNQ